MVEDMNDHVSVIQEHPTSLSLSFDTQRENTLFGKFLFDTGGNRLNLAVGSPAGNYKIVGKGRKLLHLQDD